MNEFSNKIREILEASRTSGEYSALEKDSDILTELCDSVWKSGDWKDRENIIFFFHNNRTLFERIPVETLENWVVNVLRDRKFQDDDQYTRFYNLLQWVKKPSRRLIGLAIVYIVGLEIEPSQKYFKFKEWMAKPGSPFKYGLDTAKEVEKLAGEFSPLGLRLADIVQRRIFVLAIRYYYEDKGIFGLSGDDINNWRHRLKDIQNDKSRPIDELCPTQNEVFKDFVLRDKDIDAIHRLFQSGFLKIEDGKHLSDEDIWKCVRVFDGKGVKNEYKETTKLLSFWVKEHVDTEKCIIPVDVIKWMLAYGLESWVELGIEKTYDVYRRCMSRIEKVEGETSGLFFLAGRKMPTSIFQASSKNKRLFLLALFNMVEKKRSVEDYLPEEDARELDSSRTISDDYQVWGDKVFNLAKENNWLRLEKEKVDVTRLSDAAPEIIGYENLVSKYFHSHDLGNIWPIMEAISELPLSSQFSGFLYWMDEAKGKLKDSDPGNSRGRAVDELDKPDWLQRFWNSIIHFWNAIIQPRKKNGEAQIESGVSYSRVEMSSQDHWINLVKILSVDLGYRYDKPIVRVIRSLFPRFDERVFLLSIGVFLLRGNSVKALSADDVTELGKININRFDGLLPPSLVVQLLPYLLEASDKNKAAKKNQISPTHDHERTLEGEKQPVPLWTRGALGAGGLLLIFFILWTTGILKNVGTSIAVVQTTRAAGPTLTPPKISLTDTSVPPSTPTHTLTPTPTSTSTPKSVIAGIQDWDTSTLLIYSRPASPNNEQYEIAYIDRALGPAVLSTIEEDQKRCDSVDWPFLSVITRGSLKAPRLNAACLNFSTKTWHIWYSDLLLDNNGSLQPVIDVSKKDDPQAEDKNYLDKAAYVTSRFRWSPGNEFGLQLNQRNLDDKPRIFHLFGSGFYSLKNGVFTEIDNTSLETELQAAPEILAYDWVTLEPDNDANGKNINENRGRLVVAVNEMQVTRLYDVWIQYDNGGKPEIYKTVPIPFGDFINIYDIDVSEDGNKLLVVGQMVNTEMKAMRIYNLSGETDDIPPSLALDPDYQPNIDLNAFDEMSQASWSPDPERKQIAIAGKIIDPSKLPQNNGQGMLCERGCLFVVDTATLRIGQQPGWFLIKNITSGILHFWWTQWPQ